MIHWKGEESPMRDLGDLLQSAERHLLIDGTRRLTICLDKLSEDQLWYRPNDSALSVGLTLQHLSGNIRQYIISGVGRQEDTRTRAEEFVDHRSATKDELKERLVSTIQEAVDVIKNLRPKDIQDRYEIQGFTYSFVDVLIHVIEHFSYHMGQITYITKMLTGEETGYYGGIDLNKRNDPRQQSSGEENS